MYCREVGGIRRGMVAACSSLAVGACSTAPFLVADAGVTDASLHDAEAGDDVLTTDDDAGDATFAGCTVDAAQDPKNCGFCGRDCLGAPCEKGMCVPELVATALKDPWYLTLDDAFVYWTDVNGGSILRVDKAGKTNPIHLSFNESAPFDLKVDDLSVYWTNHGDGTVVRADKRDGGTRTTLTTLADAAPLEIALDDASVYFTVEGSDASPGGVYRVDKHLGGAPSPLFSPRGSPDGLALDGTRVFFADHFDGNIASVDRAAGGAPVRIVAGLDSPSRIVVDEAYVYWLSDTVDAVQRAPKAGGAATVLATGKEVKIGGIAVDAVNVYWANSGSGTVRRVAKAGGTPVTLAEGQKVPVAVAIDQTHIYWTNRNGTILRVAK